MKPTTKQFPFSKASAFVLSFGPGQGLSLDQIAETDNGLRYLDNLRGKLSSHSYLSLCLETYLDDPVIAKELEEAMSARAFAG